MISIGIGVLLIGLLVATLEPVTEVPFGLDEPVTYFITTIHDIITYMPWFGTIWNVFIIGLIVKVTLLTAHWILWAWKFARGSG